MPPRRTRAARAAVGALGAAALLTGCHVPGFDVPQAADVGGRQSARLWHGTEFAALGVGVVVWGLIAYVIVRYRYRDRDRHRHRPSGGEEHEPSQRAANVPLEVVYTAIPLVIVGVLFALTTTAQRRIDAVSSHPDVTVDATAFQWGWRFSYPTAGVATVSSGHVPPDLVLPLGETTQVNLTATDVVHAFYVPAFLFQRAAVPGSPTTFDLTPTRLGTFPGHCSTFCGIGHATMLFTVRVVTPEQFRQWLAGGGSQAP